MTKYKETEVGEIPEEWRVMSLSEASLEITDGSHFSPREDKNGQYHIATVANITDGKIDVESCKKVSKGDYELLVRNGCKAERGNILFSKDGTVGICFVFDQEEGVALLSSIAIIRPKEILDSTFGSYVLRSHKVLTRIEGAKTGTGLKRIILKDLKGISIPLPPLHEQHAIASVLLTVDDAIAKANEAIEKTKKVKNGLADKFFREDIESVEFKPLSEVFEVKTGSTPSTKDPSFWKDADIKWLTPADLGKLDGKLTIEDSEKKISNKALEKTNLTLVPKESIIMSTRAPVGYLAILGSESTFNQGCKGLIPKDWKSTNTYYYAYYLLSQRSALENRSGQSTFKELSKDMLESFEIPVLDWDKQTYAVDGLSLMDDKIALEKSRKQKLEKIKLGLMDELLTGRKRVKIKDAL
jgi:type I restriction enzyme, S subunit